MEEWTPPGPQANLEDFRAVIRRERAIEVVHLEVRIAARAQQRRVAEYLHGNTVTSRPACAGFTAGAFVLVSWLHEGVVGEALRLDDGVNLQTQVLICNRSAAPTEARWQVGLIQG